MKWSLSSFLGTMRRFAGNVGSFFANATTLNSRQLAALLAATGASSAPEKQALKVCAWAMSAVNVITQTVAGLSVELHSGPVDSPTIVTSGPAVEFIAEPQPGQSTSWLLEQLAGHWNVGGEMNVVHNDVTMQPTPDARAVRYVAICSRPELAVNLRPDGGVLSYSYTPIDSSETMELSPLSIRRLLRFNPYSKHRGLAPLDAAALEIRQDYNAALYNASALENGGSPGGTWVLTNQPNDEQRREFERLMERRHVGAANANRMAVVWGADWKQTSFNNVDLALLDSRRFNREGIFAVFGVPPVMGGVFDAAHYNVAESSEKIFMLNTIRPLVERIEAVLNPIVEMIQPGVRVHVAIELHHVMQAIQRAMVAQLKELLASGVPYNEAVQFLQLPFKPQAWGNKSLLASGLMLADDVVAGMGTPSETPPPATPDDESDAVDDEEQAAALEWYRAAHAAKRTEESLVRAMAPDIARRVVVPLGNFERAIERAIRKHAPSEASIRTAAEMSEEQARGIARRILLEAPDLAEALKKIVAQYFPDSVEKAVAAELERLGLSAEKVAELSKAIRRGKALARIASTKGVRLSRDVDAVTRRNVEARIVKGLRAGNTVQEMTDSVRDVLGGTRARALRIARTEAGQAVSTGRYLATKAAGLKGKGWLHGANPRETHEKAEANYHPRTGAIAMDEPFRIGKASLMFPRDPSGPPEEVINCNCTMVATARPAGRSTK